MREIYELAKPYIQVLLSTALVVGACVIASVALAQASPASLPVDLSTGEALELLIKSIGGLKGAGALAIVAFCVQAVMLFFRTPLADFAGKWKLLIVSLLSLVGGVLALKLTGLDWLGSLVHSSTLTAVTVFGNQVLKQFKKAE